MKKYKKKIERLALLCKDYLDAVNGIGNECAWTDRKLETILNYASMVREEYEKDTDNKN